MKTTRHSLREKETELVKELIVECKNTSDVQEMLSGYSREQ